MIDRLRKVCLALPDVEESVMHGHPVFRILGKSFCIWHGVADDPAIALKVAKSEQGMFLEDERFFKTPYIGQHGWISIRASGRLNWKEISELVKGSYHLALPRKRKS
jgi:predicted DNA-binding protein (MmcQ/YjbR family)